LTLKGAISTSRRGRHGGFMLGFLISRRFKPSTDLSSHALSADKGVRGDITYLPRLPRNCLRIRFADDLITFFRFIVNVRYIEFAIITSA
jgi:hypothetical protein